MCLDKLRDPVKTSALLGCSADYLLGLTDELRPSGPGSNGAAQAPEQEDVIPAETVEAPLEEMQAGAQDIHPVWLPGVPERSGPVAARFSIPGVGCDMTNLCWYDAAAGRYLFSEEGATIDAECTGWWPVPDGEVNHADDQ